MHRQSSRSTANMDTIDCIVNTSDLALEDEALKREHDNRSKPRRDQPSKRSNDSPAHRSHRHSPPSVTRKHHPSPHSFSSSSSSSAARPPPPSHQHHHHHQQYPSQRHHRASPRSPSPPTSPSAQPSSRHHRPTRPVVSAKRPYPQSESPNGRYPPPTHRSRPELPAERPISNTLTSIATLEEPKITSKQAAAADLSLISEDESTKTYDIRSNSTKANESSPITTSNQLHSTPSLPIRQSNLNQSLLEMSTIPQEHELSLYAKSALSTTNTSSILTPPKNNSTNDFMQTIDLISKYKTMQTIPNTNPQIEAWSREIWVIIQKQIELQKIELDCREREIKLRERELAEREKRFKPSESNSTMASANSEPFLITKPNIIEEITESKSEIPINQQDIITIISPDESVSKSIPSVVDTSKPKSTTKTSTDQPSVARKTRFSQLIVDPFSQPKPTIDLYSDDLDAPAQSIPIAIGTDLKITSSSTCRKVEIQSGNNDKTTTANKGSSDDLRLTLGKIRTKQQSNDEYGINGEPTINDLELPIKNNDNKQQSHDYQQQRSVTSTSIETIIDETPDKPDVRRHRQQQQPYSSSSNNNPNQRSYTHGSTAKYGSNQKRYENDDLRSRIFDHKQPKPSRTNRKNNY